LIVNSPISSTLGGAVSPGSLIPLSGIGLSESAGSAAPPLPRTLAGVRVRIGGVDAPVQSVSPELVWIQVPWETPLQDAAPFEFQSGDSPFETGPGALAVQPWAPHPYVTSDSTTGYEPYFIAVHQDWSGLITYSSPAKPGEAVTVYFNGLGPVAPAVASGQSAPVDPLAKATSAFGCRSWDNRKELQVYFAGLAPGMVGIYQVTFEVPLDAQGPSFGAICDAGPGTASAYGFLYVSP
jgi:uncharacterized protein (TIGR03437 family)